MEAPSPQPPRRPAGKALLHPLVGRGRGSPKLRQPGGCTAATGERERHRRSAQGRAMRESAEAKATSTDAQTRQTDREGAGGPRPWPARPGQRQPKLSAQSSASASASPSDLRRAKQLQSSVDHRHSEIRDETERRWPWLSYHLLPPISTATGRLTISHCAGFQALRHHLRLLCSHCSVDGVEGAALPSRAPSAYTAAPSTAEPQTAVARMRRSVEGTTAAAAFPSSAPQRAVHVEFCTS